MPFFRRKKEEETALKQDAVEEQDVEADETVQPVLPIENIGIDLEELKRMKPPVDRMDYFSECLTYLTYLNGFLQTSVNEHMTALFSQMSYESRLGSSWFKQVYDFSREYSVKYMENIAPLVKDVPVFEKRMNADTMIATAKYIRKEAPTENLGYSGGTSYNISILTIYNFALMSLLSETSVAMQLDVNFYKKLYEVIGSLTTEFIDFSTKNILGKSQDVVGVPVTMKNNKNNKPIPGYG
ncbi:MAG TPA: hypothetical protein VJH34_02415 [archaeon]|nr:hypothetical protein [archaeon]